ncbi:hypothetical protein F3087_05325 [Nocardia colli]|uniref:Uncharacterized protein n=1 Tax=Nocardia colli TaxID=2545717 RepID=A0A5N0ER31_9NOCA|nr:hypothetical protein [Nocardia colli]KAA8890675.1 hypothetical protein F3087_05325 [Nocardia colli]
MTYARESSRVAGPSGVVATTTGVLALVAGLFNLWGERTVLSALRDGPHVDKSFAIFSTLGALLAAIALIYGAVQLLRRDETGRYILILTSGLLTVASLVALYCSVFNYQPDYGIDWLPEQRRSLEIVNANFDGLIGTLTALLHREWIASLVSAVLPLVIFLLASSGRTSRWVTYSPPRTEIPDNRATFGPVDA